MHRRRRRWDTRIKRFDEIPMMPNRQNEHTFGYDNWTSHQVQVIYFRFCFIENDRPPNEMLARTRSQIGRVHISSTYKSRKNSGQGMKKTNRIILSRRPLSTRSHFVDAFMLLKYISIITMLSAAEVK